MNIVVGILDRDNWQANTDVLVVADEHREELLWIPRDLWCDSFADRVNTAFVRGGHSLLHEALREHGCFVAGGLILRRAATENLLAGARVTVPVERRLDFWYPLSPTERVEDGKKMISFRPPTETLAGERVHQWIGARKPVQGSGSDLGRIVRQQTLIRALLADGFDFSSAVADPSLVSVSEPNIWRELRHCSPRWPSRTLGPLRNATIDGKSVLLRYRQRSAGWWIRQSSRGLVRRLRERLSPNKNR